MIMTLFEAVSAGTKKTYLLCMSDRQAFTTSYNVGSVLWRLFSTLEVLQYIGGITSVLWGIASILWGDSFSTVEAVQYSGGIASVLWGDSFSTVEVIQYSGGITSVNVGG